MKNLLLIFVLALTSISCTKIFTDYVPPEMVGEWEWEYTIVKNSYNGVLDTIYPKDISKGVDFDGTIKVYKNGNINLVSNEYNHMKLKNREMISNTGDSTYYSKYGLSKNYNLSDPSTEFPPNGVFKYLRMKMQVNTEKIIVQGFPVDGIHLYAYTECAVLNKNESLYALNYFKKK